MEPIISARFEAFLPALVSGLWAGLFGLYCYKLGYKSGREDEKNIDKAAQLLIKEGKDGE